VSELNGAFFFRRSWLQKKVSAKEVEELVRGERKVPLIVEFYATWCGPCVQMAQDIEMVRHAPLLDSHPFGFVHSCVICDYLFGR
jgi:thiol-disulfide isomerase/thioredoxin